MKRWIALSCLLGACADSTIASSPVDAGGPDAETGPPPFEVPVTARETTYVALDGPRQVGAKDAWDLAFTGWDVFTNGGASGSGKGGAFGPHAPLVCATDAPAVPIVIRDSPGGAFTDWYAYDSTSHALYSRFHVYGVRDGSRTFKVQILSYYREVAGAPTSAVYRVRYAELGGPTRELTNVDATAGGSGGTGPSACVDLGTGTVVRHTQPEAAAANDWHLCFRRDTIAVNGEQGGPRGVVAVDADASETPKETLPVVSARTAATETGRFDAETLADPALVFRGDRVRSAFSDVWFVGEPRAPASACWVVLGADGVSRFALLFEGFSGATAASPGVVSLRARKFQGGS